MNNLKYLSAIIVILSINFTSCDVIEEPFIDLQDNVSDSCESFNFSEIPNNPTRKILLEDYTGHKCGNCPRAAEKAEELKEIYGDQLILLAIHAGFFAGDFGGNFSTDFTTDTGDEWDDFFGNSAAGNPNGMINRVGHPSSHIKQHSQWAQIVENQIQTPAKMGLQIMTTLNQNDSLICIDVKSEVKQPLSSPLSLNIVLTESEIIAYQQDYDANPQEIPDYHHNHVLRKSLTGVWGQPLDLENYENGDYLINRYSTKVDENWNTNNMSIIAFISNTDTYEILQVEEIKITE